LERKLDFEAGKPQEVAVIGAQRGAVLDGEGGKVSVHDQGATRAGPGKQSAQDLPMPLMSTDNHHVVLGIVGVWLALRASSNSRGLANNLGVVAKRRKPRIVSHERPTLAVPESKSLS
jgi:hypothetical protein